MKRLISLLLCLLVFSLAGPYNAGARPVGTPISSLPYTITQSGSYYITGDLTSVSNGIVVNANNVTIDLMGHSIVGPGTASGYTTGIYIKLYVNVEIRNGTVRNFGWNGIGAQMKGSSHRVINVRAVSNGVCGIDVKGYGILVKDCTASHNGWYGIIIDYGSTAKGNIAYSNNNHGIHANQGCTVTGNTVYDNKKNGILVGYGCTVTGNTAVHNRHFGIELGNHNFVDGNTAYNNNLSGGNYANIDSCSSCTFGLNYAP